MKSRTEQTARQARLRSVWRSGQQGARSQTLIVRDYPGKRGSHAAALSAEDQQKAQTTRTLNEYFDPSR